MVTVLSNGAKRFPAHGPQVVTAHYVDTINQRVLVFIFTKLAQLFSSLLVIREARVFMTVLRKFYSFICAS